MQNFRDINALKQLLFATSPSWSICVFAKWQTNIDESTIYSYQNAM